MSQFLPFITKETKHILRDRRTMLVLFGMPIVMMLLFGFAISTDVKNVRVVIVTSSIDNLTMKIAERLDNSEYFDICFTVSTPAEAKQLLTSNSADMAVVFAPGFANNIYNGSASIQLISDYTDPNMAELQSNYAQQIILSEVANISPIKLKPPTITRLLYNPQMKSSYNFVPGIMGMLFMIICAMMTSVSIVKEKERGTMEVLLVSPVRPIVIIISKAVPYMALSLIILTFVLIISKFILAVPIAGSLLLIYSISMLYIILSLSLGLLISVVAKTQVAALLMSGMLLLMPSIMLSGMIYPVESMPQILQYISDIVPARWYISALRKVMIMGVGITMIWKELIVMVAMTIVLLIVALNSFKTRLE